MWSTRRQELTAAALAAAVLAEELRWMRSRTTRGPDSSGLEKAWCEHRGALIARMEPRHVRMLGDSLRAVSSGESQDVERMRSRIEQLWELLWSERERFPAIPV